MKQEFDVSNERADLSFKHIKKDKLGDLTATLRIEGNPLVESDSTISIDGVDEIHNGKWYVKSVRHRINTSGGYICELELLKNASNSPASVGADGVDKFKQDQKKQNFPFESSPQNNSDVSNVAQRKPRQTSKVPVPKYNANGDVIKNG